MVLKKLAKKGGYVPFLTTKRDAVWCKEHKFTGWVSTETLVHNRLWTKALVLYQTCQKIIARTSPQIEGYWLKHTYYIEGYWLKHTYYNLMV